MSRTVPLLAAALCAAVLWNAGPDRCLGVETSPAEKKIEEALRSPTALEFIETPLSEVVEYLKDAHRIDIQFDSGVLRNAGIKKDEPITRNVKGISLRSALNLMLAELKLTYLVQDEVLLITTIKDAKGRLSTKVYPVADLLPPGNQPGQRQAKCEELVRVITTTIAPESWRCGPGAGLPPGAGYGAMGGMGQFPPGGAVGGMGGGEAGGGMGGCEAGGAGPGCIAAAAVTNVEVLVISQSYQVHRQIAELLAELRKETGLR